MNFLFATFSLAAALGMGYRILIRRSFQRPDLQTLDAVCRVAHLIVTLTIVWIVVAIAVEFAPWRLLLAAFFFQPPF